MIHTDNSLPFTKLPDSFYGPDIMPVPFAQPGAYQSPQPVQPQNPDPRLGDVSAGFLDPLPDQGLDGLFNFAPPNMEVPESVQGLGHDGAQTEDLAAPGFLDEENQSSPAGDQQENHKKGRKRKGPADLLWCFKCSIPGHVADSKACSQGTKVQRLSDFRLNLHWRYVSDQDIQSLDNMAFAPGNLAGWMTLLQIYKQQIFAPYEAFAAQRDELIRKILQALSARRLLGGSQLTALKKIFGDTNRAVLRFLRKLSETMAELRIAVEQNAIEVLGQAHFSREQIAQWIATGVGQATISIKEEQRLAFHGGVLKRLEDYGGAILALRAQQVQIMDEFVDPPQILTRVMMLPSKMAPLVEGCIVLNKQDYFPKEPLSKFKYPDLRAVVAATGLFDDSQGGIGRT
jgi:hypothetical protein